MPVSIKAVKLTVRDLLRSDWNNDNVPISIDNTDIHTGWYEDGKGFPQVGVYSSNGGPFGGGQSGFSAIAGDGSGGIQTRSGTVYVTVFAGSRDDYESTGLQEYQADQMAQEIERIIGLNQAPGELEVLSVNTRSDTIDTNETPPEYNSRFGIRFVWKKTPP